MEYEKKYKESLAMARDYYKANLKLNKADENLILEDIFPELKESKDERIRKDILGFVKDVLDNKPHLTPRTNQLESWIAWLEKQGEQKPQGKSALEAINEEKFDNANKVESKDYSSIDPHFFKPADKA